MPDPLHLRSWDVTPAEARALQHRLRGEVREEPLDVDALRTVAGADISFDRGSDTVFAGIVVIDLRSGEVMERVGVRTEACFP